MVNGFLHKSRIMRPVWGKSFLVFQRARTFCSVTCRWTNINVLTIFQIIAKLVESVQQINQVPAVPKNVLVLSFWCENVFTTCVKVCPTRPPPARQRRRRRSLQLALHTNKKPTYYVVSWKSETCTIFTRLGNVQVWESATQRPWTPLGIQ